MVKIKNYYFSLILLIVVNLNSKAQNQIGGEITLGVSQTIASDPNNIFSNGYFPSIIFSFPYYKQKKGYKLIFMPQIQGLAYGVKSNFSKAIENTNSQEWYLNITTGIANDFKFNNFL